MKKVIKSLLALSLIVLLVGCGEKKETKEEVKDKTYKCTLSSNDIVNGFKVESVYEIYATGDVVKKVKTEEKVTSDDETILDTFENTLNTTYEAADKNYGGYDYSVTRNDNEVLSITTIDYTKMNLKQYIKDNSALSQYVNDNNELTAEGIKSLYTSMGATCD